jgi:DNA-3-methyladenine glycosylase II
MKIKGIGPWTADIYLLMALLRPDIWPAGDLALATAVQKLKGLAVRPGVEELEQIAQPWRPWRAVAARLLWHYYLSGYKNLTADEEDTCTSTHTCPGGRCKRG